MIRAFTISFVLIILALPAHAQGKRFLDIQEVTSPGGIKAWLVEDHSVPVIAMEFAFASSGSSLDPADKQGVAQLLSNTLDEGSGDLDSQTFQKKLADHSISLSFNSGRDDFYGSLKTLTRHKDMAFELTRLALTAPRFDAEPLQRMKDANIVRIRSSLSDPEWMAARIMNDTVYAGHVYARNSGGTISGLQSITADDLRAFVKANLTRDRLRVAVVGDIKAEELPKILDTVFGKLPAASKPSPVPDTTLQNAGVTVLYNKQDIPQTIIEIAQPGISRKDPDWQAAQIMNFILGSSGFGSRLMEEIREKRGLTYGIYTSFYPLDHLATMTASLSTRNETAKEALELIKAEWVKMRDTDVTDKELSEAKAYLIGSMPLSLSSTDGIAGMMLGLMLDDLPSTYLDTLDQKIFSVTTADVRRVAEELLDPDKFVTVLVGNPAGVTPTKTIEVLPNVE